MSVDTQRITRRYIPEDGTLKVIRDLNFASTNIWCQLFINSALMMIIIIILMELKLPLYLSIIVRFATYVGRV
jgi:hypothetical protein